MLFPSSITEKIVKAAYWADRTIRSELAMGLIAGENDYSSNLTGAFRRQINELEIPGLHATSYVLKPAEERAFGANGCIILSNTSQFKVCLFEAKLPRLSTRKNSWDYLQTSSGVSHFHEQLSRQSAFNHRFAIWEVFYCDYPFEKQPSFFPMHVSSCVWYEDAFAASRGRPNNRTRWTDSELSDLLTTYGSTIGDFIRDVCDCKKGDLFHGQTYQSVFDNFGIPGEWLLIEYTAPHVSNA